MKRPARHEERSRRVASATPSAAVYKGITPVLSHATKHENEPPRSQRPQSPVLSLRTLWALR
jgi:hypothetical protein